MRAMRLMPNGMRPLGPCGTPCPEWDCDTAGLIWKAGDFHCELNIGHEGMHESDRAKWA